MAIARAAIPIDQGRRQLHLAENRRLWRDRLRWAEAAVMLEQARMRRNGLRPSLGFLGTAPSRESMGAPDQGASEMKADEGMDGTAVIAGGDLSKIDRLYYPELDALRFSAFLFVFLQHTGGLSRCPRFFPI